MFNETQLAFFAFYDDDGTLNASKGELVEVYSTPFMFDLQTDGKLVLCVALRWLACGWDDIAGCAGIIPIGEVAKELLDNIFHNRYT